MMHCKQSASSKQDDDKRAAPESEIEINAKARQQLFQRALARTRQKYAHIIEALARY